MTIAATANHGGTLATTGTSITLSGQTTTNGNTLIVCVQGDQSVTSLTTNGTSVITSIGSATKNSQNVALYRVNVTSGVTSITANLAGTTANTHLDFQEFSGIVDSDKVVGASGTSATVAHPAVTPSADDSLLVAAGQNANFASGTYGTWTGIAGPGDNTFAYKIQSGSPTSDSLSVTLFGSADWAAMTTTFAPIALGNVNAGNASGSGQAFNPVFGGTTTANAGVASGVGTAYDIAGPNANARPGAAIGSGAARNIDSITHFGPAGAAAIANQPAVKLGPVPSVPSATGTGQNAHPAIAPQIGTPWPIGSGAAWNATINTGNPDRSVTPQVATGAGVVNPASFLVSGGIGSASATGTAQTVKANPGGAPAAASGTGTAYAIGAAGTSTTQPAIAIAIGTAYNPTTSTPVLIVFRFTPPTEDSVSNIAFDQPHEWNRLMRYFPVRKRGRAVWVLPDDTLTFDQPYPTVLDDANGRASLFPPVPTPPSGLGTSDSNLKQTTYKKVYEGGHEYTFTDIFEYQRIYDFLTNEGYDPADWLVTV